MNESNPIGIMDRLLFVLFGYLFVLLFFCSSIVDLLRYSNDKFQRNYAGKQRRLKQAKEEAQEEIEKYRLERDRQFKEFEAKVSD